MSAVAKRDDAAGPHASDVAKTHAKNAEGSDDILSTEISKKSASSYVMMTPCSQSFKMNPLEASSVHRTEWGWGRPAPEVMEVLSSSYSPISCHVFAVVAVINLRVRVPRSILTLFLAVTSQRCVYCNTARTPLPPHATSLTPVSPHASPPREAAETSRGSGPRSQPQP